MLLNLAILSVSGETYSTCGRSSVVYSEASASGLSLFIRRDLSVDWSNLWIGEGSSKALFLVTMKLRKLFCCCTGSLSCNSFAPLRYFEWFVSTLELGLMPTIPYTESYSLLYKLSCAAISLSFVSDGTDGHVGPVCTCTGMLTISSLE